MFTFIWLLVWNLKLWALPFFSLLTFRFAYKILYTKSFRWKWTRCFQRWSGKQPGGIMRNKTCTHLSRKFVWEWEMAANVARRVRCAFRMNTSKLLAAAVEGWKKERKLTHKSWGNSRYNRSKMKWHHVVEICCFPFSFSFCYPYLIVIPMAWLLCLSVCA